MWFCFNVACLWTPGCLICILYFNFLSYINRLITVLALANNQNIITKLVTHGGMIFYSAYTVTHYLLIHPCTQTHTGTTLPLHTPPLHLLTYMHRSHPHKARVHRSLMPPVKLSPDFVSLLSCIISGSNKRWVRLWQTSPGPQSLGRYTPMLQLWPSQPKSLGLAPLSHYLQAF